MPAPKQPGLSTEAYYGLAEEVDSDLVEGKLVPRANPRALHGRVLARLCCWLSQVIDESGGDYLGVGCDLPTGEGSVRRADVVFVEAARRSSIDADGVFVEPPTLVVEIAAVGDEARDYGEKWREYARFGVHHYWIAGLASQTVEQYSLKGGAYQLLAHLESTDRLTSPLFPALNASLRRLFRWP